MNETARILCAISDAGSITYLNLTKKAQSHPSQVMAIMETLEDQELVTVDRSQPPARIRLTSLGAERAREAREASR
jgi:DNA-binding MarR family transcriptional regulator